MKKLNRALEVDPLSPTANFISGLLFFHAKQYDEAMEKLRNTIEMAPNHMHAHAWLGRIYSTKSMYEEAFEEFSREREISRGANFWIDVLSGEAHIKMGEREKAREFLDDLVERANEQIVTPTAPAMLHFLVGENDQCFAWIQWHAVRSKIS
jgi:tetratricopeptide (TPR) repeat protein